MNEITKEVYDERITNIVEHWAEDAIKKFEGLTGQPAPPTVREVMLSSNRVAISNAIAAFMSLLNDMKGQPITEEKLKVAHFKQEWNEAMKKNNKDIN